MYLWWFPRSIFLALLTLGSSFCSRHQLAPVVGAEPSSKEVVRRWTLSSSSSSVYSRDCGGGDRRGCIIVFASFCAPCDDGARVRQLKNNSEISTRSGSRSELWGWKIWRKENRDEKIRKFFGFHLGLELLDPLEAAARVGHFFLPLTLSEIFRALERAHAHTLSPVLCFWSPCSSVCSGTLFSQLPFHNTLHKKPARKSPKRTSGENESRGRKEEKSHLSKKRKLHKLHWIIAGSVRFVIEWVCSKENPVFLQITACCV